MLPSSLPLPYLWNFLLPIPASDRISRFQVRFRFQFLSSKCFRFHKNLTASAPLLSIKQLIAFSIKKAGKFTLSAILFDLGCRQGMVWNGRRFFHIPYWKFPSISFPFHTKNLPFHNKNFFHISFHTSLPKKV